MVRNKSNHPHGGGGNRNQGGTEGATKATTLVSQEEEDNQLMASPYQLVIDASKLLSEISQKRNSYMKGQKRDLIKLVERCARMDHWRYFIGPVYLGFESPGRMNLSDIFRKIEADGYLTPEPLSRYDYPKLMEDFTTVLTTPVEEFLPQNSTTDITDALSKSERNNINDISQEGNKLVFRIEGKDDDDNLEEEEEEEEEEISKSSSSPPPAQPAPPPSQGGDSYFSSQGTVESSSSSRSAIVGNRILKQAMEWLQNRQIRQKDDLQKIRIEEFMEKIADVNREPAMSSWRKEPIPKRDYEEINGYKAAEGLNPEESDEILQKIVYPLPKEKKNIENFWVLPDGLDELEIWSEVLMLDKLAAEKGENLEDWKGVSLTTGDIVEADTWGIDCFTRRNIEFGLGIIEQEDLRFSAAQARFFIEGCLLREINARPKETGYDMTHALKAIVRNPKACLEACTSLPTSLYDRNISPKKLKNAAETILKLIPEWGQSNFAVHPKGVGVICKKPIKAGQFVVPYFGELYPCWLWEQKEQAEDVMRQKARESGNGRVVLPDFWNMRLELPSHGEGGYDLMHVDAKRMGNFAARMSHSCRPNCGTMAAVIDGKYCVAMRSLRKIEAGEELCIDYNCVTDSIEEFRAAVCLCGAHDCRGSYLYVAGAKQMVEVAERSHSPLHRLGLLLQSCKASRSLLSGCPTTPGHVNIDHLLPDESVPDDMLIKHGVKKNVLGSLPSWMKKFGHLALEFVENERLEIPSLLIAKNPIPGEPSDDKERWNMYQLQGNGLVAQRISNLVGAFDKARHFMNERLNENRWWIGDQCLVKNSLCSTNTLPPPSSSSLDAGEEEGSVLANITYVHRRQRNIPTVKLHVIPKNSPFHHGFLSSDNISRTENGTGSSLETHQAPFRLLDDVEACYALWNDKEHGVAVRCVRAIQNRYSKPVILWQQAFDPIRNQPYWWNFVTREVREEKPTPTMGRARAKYTPSTLENLKILVESRVVSTISELHGALLALRAIIQELPTVGNRSLEDQHQKAIDVLTLLAHTQNFFIMTEPEQGAAILPPEVELEWKASEVASDTLMLMDTGIAHDNQHISSFSSPNPVSSNTSTNNGAVNLNHPAILSSSNTVTGKKGGKKTKKHLANPVPKPSVVIVERSESKSSTTIGSNTSADPDGNLSERKKIHREDHQLSHHHVICSLMSWLGRDDSECTEITEMLGSALLPVIESCYRDDANLGYCTIVRGHLLRHISSIKERYCPWPAQVKDSFPDACAPPPLPDRNALKHRPPPYRIFGSPMLDVALTELDDYNAACDKARRLPEAILYNKKDMIKTVSISWGGQDKNKVFNRILTSLRHCRRSRFNLPAADKQVIFPPKPPAEIPINWIQCEKPDCLKWRKLPIGKNPEQFSEPFFCEHLHNTDPIHAKCEVPEEPSEAPTISVSSTIDKDDVVVLAVNNDNNHHNNTSTTTAEASSLALNTDMMSNTPSTYLDMNQLKVGDRVDAYDLDSLCWVESEVVEVIEDAVRVRLKVVVEGCDDDYRDEWVAKLSNETMRLTPAEKYTKSLAPIETEIAVLHTYTKKPVESSKSNADSHDGKRSSSGRSGKRKYDSKPFKNGTSANSSQFIHSNVNNEEGTPEEEVSKVLNQILNRVVKLDAEHRRNENLHKVKEEGLHFRHNASLRAYFHSYFSACKAIDPLMPFTRIVSRWNAMDERQQVSWELSNKHVALSMSHALPCYIKPGVSLPISESSLVVKAKLPGMPNVQSHIVGVTNSEKSNTVVVAASPSPTMKGMIVNTPFGVGEIAENDTENNSVVITCKNWSAKVYAPNSTMLFRSAVCSPATKDWLVSDTSSLMAAASSGTSSSITSSKSLSLLTKKMKQKRGDIVDDDDFPKKKKKIYSNNNGNVIKESEVNTGLRTKNEKIEYEAYIN